jgi:hypothetical protein
MGPGDIAAFEARVVDSGGCFLPRRNPEAIPIAHLSTADLPDWPAGCAWLVRPCDLPAVVLRHVPAQHYWAVDTTMAGSPVVEYGFFWQSTSMGSASLRESLTSMGVREGRLWFEKYYVENDAWAEKPPDFVLWAEGILRFVRKHFRRDADADLYVGPHAAGLLDGRQG